MYQPEKLDKRQKRELALIRQASPSAETAYGLAQAFMHMIREQTGQQLDTWLSEVAASHLPELESFAKGIQQDKAAVVAGLTLPSSLFQERKTCLKASAAIRWPSLTR